MNQLIEQIQERIDLFSQKLAPKGYTMLEACPWIVASPDAGFVVSVDRKNGAVIEWGHSDPHQFSPQAAERIVQVFKPCNGHGPIILVKMSRQQYWQTKLDQANQVLATLNKTVR